MTYKLSPSRLNLLNECPRCFWLMNNGIWQRPTGIFASLPNGMDIILKTHFDKFRDKGELPPEICENNHCDGMKLFDDKEKLKIWQNNFKGVRFADSEGNVLFGAVDNILKKGNKLIVLDYKTRGFPIKEDSVEYGKKYYQNQLNIYNYLLRKEGYETEDYAFLLFYIPNKVTETGEVIFDTELVKIDVDVEEAEMLWNEALRILREDCPKDRCEWCGLVDDE